MSFPTVPSTAFAWTDGHSPHERTQPLAPVALPESDLDQALVDAQGRPQFVPATEGAPSVENPLHHGAPLVPTGATRAAARMAAAVGIGDAASGEPPMLDDAPAVTARMQATTRMASIGERLVAEQASGQQVTLALPPGAIDPARLAALLAERVRPVLREAILSAVGKAALAEQDAGTSGIDEEPAMRTGRPDANTLSRLADDLLRLRTAGGRADLPTGRGASALVAAPGAPTSPAASASDVLAASGLLARELEASLPRPAAPGGLPSVPVSAATPASAEAAAALAEGSVIDVVARAEAAIVQPGGPSSRTKHPGEDLLSRLADDLVRGRAASLGAAAGVEDAALAEPATPGAEFAAVVGAAQGGARSDALSTLVLSLVAPPSTRATPQADDPHRADPEGEGAPVPAALPRVLRGRVALSGGQWVAFDIGFGAAGISVDVGASPGCAPRADRTIEQLREALSHLSGMGRVSRSAALDRSGGEGG